MVIIPLQPRRDAALVKVVTARQSTYPADRMSVPIQADGALDARNHAQRRLLCCYFGCCPTVELPHGQVLDVVGRYGGSEPQVGQSETLDEYLEAVVQLEFGQIARRGEGSGPEEAVDDQRPI